MAILGESVDLVIEGSDFYRSIQKAPRPKLKNGWCDFRLLANQQAREIADKFVLGSILYFDPRENSRTEDSYGSVQRRKLWFGRLRSLNVSPVSPNLDHLARREFSANVLVLSSQESPLRSGLEHLQESKGFSTGLLLPPGESETGGLTHGELEDVQLRGDENDWRWNEYWTLKQDSDQIAALWQTWSPEIRQAVQKRMRSSLGRKNYPTRLNSLAADPGREKEFLYLAKTDLVPFSDAIRKDNRRLASTPECAKFCLEMAVRAGAVAELSQLQPPAARTTVRRCDVNLHERFQRETEKWPYGVREELREKCELLQERGQLASPLVAPVAGSRNPSLTRLRLSGGGGAYRVLFARDDDGNYLLLAGGKKRGFSDERFYRDMKEIAASRNREWSR